MRNARYLWRHYRLVPFASEGDFLLIAHAFINMDLQYLGLLFDFFALTLLAAVLLVDLFSYK